jgi:hypothetical protein
MAVELADGVVELTVGAALSTGTVKVRVVAVAKSLLDVSLTQLFGKVRVYDVPVGRSEVGSMVSVFPSVDMVGVLNAIELFALSIKDILENAEPAWMASENVTVIVLSVATVLAPAVGSVELTLGAVTSGTPATVKVMVELAANELPFESLIAPAGMVALYVPLRDRSVVGSSNSSRGLLELIDLPMVTCLFAESFRTIKLYAEPGTMFSLNLTMMVLFFGTPAAVLVGSLFTITGGVLSLRVIQE